MAEELHKYKIYIATFLTSLASFVLSFTENKTPEYVIAPISLVATLALCRLTSHIQLTKEIKEAKNLSEAMLDKATKIQTIISASVSKEEQDNDFEKSKKALDEMLATHIAEMQSEYNDKKDTIKRLQTHQDKLSQEMFDAAKKIDPTINENKDKV
ncbi:hypothetical protein ACTMBH_18045 [Klebsiella pneumoniae]|uniref:hypothetical protein n=1 Tax=Klebsiella pneumoniae TaxID=573 RepID=UPI002274636E